MTTPPLPGLRELLAQRGRPPFTSLQLERRPLAGGLEAELTEDVMARFLDGRGKPHALRFIAKHLSGKAAREADVYRALRSKRSRAPTPRLLGSARTEAGCVLYLERIVPKERWPWDKQHHIRALLEAISTFHASCVEEVLSIPPWEYEVELASSAEATREALEATARQSELAPLRRALPALDRLVLALPRMRKELLAASLGSTAIHGDLHSGNVLVPRSVRTERPVLIDWGRARIGSPLEDVSSWLQSLGYWEPEARRRHDTLFASYLAAQGRSAQLNGETRESYWLAAASNVLAGALVYHLHCAATATDAHARGPAAHRALDCLRVVRRADALWS